MLWGPAKMSSLAKNVLLLLVECRFWYSVCHSNTHTHTHAHTHTHTNFKHPIYSAVTWLNFASVAWLTRHLSQVHGNAAWDLWCRGEMHMEGLCSDLSVMHPIRFHRWCCRNQSCKRLLSSQLYSWAHKQRQPSDHDVWLNQGLFVF